MRKLAGKLALLLFGLILGLVAAEVAVRLVSPQPLLVIDPGLYAPDPPGRYRLVPGYAGQATNRVEFTNALRINSSGLRGAEVAPRDGRLRIMVIGDSFTFGIGVEEDETFIERLAKLLNETGRPAVALNGGLPGFGIPDAAGWYERHGSRLEPDVVLLAVFLGNDLLDASSEAETVRIDDGLVTVEQTPRGLRNWLFQHSHLFLMAKLAVPVTLQRPIRSALGLGEPWVVRNLRGEFAFYKREHDETTRRAVRASDAAVARLVELARPRGTSLRAVLLPALTQIDQRRWTGALELLALDPATHDPAEPARIFTDIFERHGIPVLDLTAPLSLAHERGEVLYYTHDRHWTPAGHELAAHELTRFLAEEGRVDGE